MTRKKQITRKKAIKDLDKVFSRFIRLRDSKDGIGTCITCGRMKEWKYMDCGHYIPRQHLGTRWDEKNCACQCKRCNGFEGGRMDIFAKKIDLKYGKGTAELLEIKSKQVSKYDQFTLQVLIEHYEKETKKLEI